MQWIALRRTVPSLALALLAVLALGPGAALAHERRAVGDYSFLVGFNVEPTYEGEVNGAQLTVTDPSNNNAPITGLQDTLKAQIGFGGGQPKEFPLTPVSSKPGQYVAQFIPTRAGSYIFTFTGTVNGQPVNERFESGPGRFDDVQPATAIQFPDQVPAANDAARTASNAADQASAAQAAADSARTIALAGVGVGLIGVVIGIVGIITATGRRRTAESQLRTA